MSITETIEANKINETNEIEELASRLYTYEAELANLSAFLESTDLQRDAKLSRLRDTIVNGLEREESLIKKLRRSVESNNGASTV